MVLRIKLNKSTHQIEQILELVNSFNMMLNVNLIIFKSLLGKWYFVILM